MGRQSPFDSDTLPIVHLPKISPHALSVMQDAAML